MGFIDTFLNNDYLVTKYDKDNLSISIISKLKISTSLGDYVNSFINEKLFPYTNTTYGQLVDDSKAELTEDQIFEIRSIIKGYMLDLSRSISKNFQNKDNDALKEEYNFSDNDLLQNSKEELFKKVKGGEFCEMLLASILIHIGYEKIISKLYWEMHSSTGAPTPTGIDVTFIKKCERSYNMVLGECKIFANIDDAIKACAKDLEKIIDGNKFNDELLLWGERFTQIPENVREYLKDLNLKNIRKEELISRLNETDCIGFVLGTEVAEEEILNFLKNIKINNPYPAKMNIYLVVVPVKSKEEFVKACESAVQMLGKKYED